MVITYLFPLNYEKDFHGYTKLKADLYYTKEGSEVYAHEGSLVYAYKGSNITNI